MNFRTILTITVIVSCLFCGVLVVESGIFRTFGAGGPCTLLQMTTDDIAGAAVSPAQAKPQLQPAPGVVYSVSNAPAKTVILGAEDPNTEGPETGFKFQLQLTSKGAAIAKAIFSNRDGKGFDDRDHENPQPLVLLSPAGLGGNRQLFSMANGAFVFVDQQLRLPLDKLNWKSLPVETAGDGSQVARFEAVIKDKSTAEPVIKLTKTYRVTPGIYHLDCDITVENLSDGEQKVRYNLTGPTGLQREALRTDGRKAIAGFSDTRGQVTSMRLGTRRLQKAKTIDDRQLRMPNAAFLWAAVANKYFAAIVVPTPEEGKNFCDWVTDRTARFYNPDADKRADSGDENISLDLSIASAMLGAAENPSSSRNYHFLIYLGPKDKSLFDKNELYKGLGFFHTIDFMPCFCCPAAIIHPLAFGILALMKWLYFFIPNYGVVIIIFVFLVRLALHPLTKKSQISMSKMGKLAPMAEEIKKKYAGDKAEMNRRMMALYKEHGASPVMGMLPMFAQMPIWIALYSAIYASIELRGASFLPFWITDLSAPDALFRFEAITLPLFGVLDSFNLLPIMMGVAFYLQQKLMPSQAAASTNPQMAQQQKMMMIMLPVLFPLMLYKAPSGLNLYIMSSVFAGVVEQYVIKKHIREKEQAEAQGLVPVTSKTGGKVKKKKPKPFYKM